jgi:hypothetical protein
MSEAVATQTALPAITNQPGTVIPMEIYAYFGINDPAEISNSETKRKLNNILAYAWEKTGGGELGDLLLAIREVEDGMATPDINSQRYDKVFHYITIQRQINDLEKQRKAFAGK